MKKSVQLNKDAERRVFAGHHWIFSNDVNVQQTPLKNFQAGDLVKIETSRGKVIALGYINPNCLLCIRVLTTQISEQIDVHFFKRKIQSAKSKRENFFKEPYYRLVFGDADHLPGLVIDQFNDVVVVQINTAGMENLKKEIEGLGDYKVNLNN